MPVEVVFDGDNSYPDCEGCGKCCELNILAVTRSEFERMCEYVDENNVQPIDYDGQRCCFQNPDRSCMVWEARSQTCKLHHCKVPRKQLLEINPSLDIPEDKLLLDLHETFINGFRG